MRVIVWGINYAPELTGIGPFNTGLCDYLRSRGHHVRMVTSFPYYPQWKKVSGDRGTIYRTDDIDGVWIHRCWHYVPARLSTLRRVIHELSFLMTSTVRTLFLPRPDVYIIVSPPLFLGLGAALVGLIRRRPYVFHVQDLQPDAALSLGMVRNGALVQLLYWIEKRTYGLATRVSGISEGMLRAFAAKQVPGSKVLYFPNWIRFHAQNIGPDLSDERAETRSRYRAKFGLDPESFVAIYAGNIGKKQGLDQLIDAAQILERTGSGRKIEIIIVGDGAARRELDNKIRVSGLRNLRLLGLLLESDYNGLMIAADIALILQQAGTGRFFFPSKLLTALALRLPVLTVAGPESELARVVADGDFGLNVAPNQSDELAQGLTLLSRDQELLARYRSNTSWVEQFSPDRVLPQYERQLIEALQ